jgi:hypothetical protein
VSDIATAPTPFDPDDEILPEWLFDEDDEDEPDDVSGRYAGRPAPLAQSG